MNLEQFKKVVEDYIIEGVSFCINPPKVNIEKKWLDELNKIMPSRAINDLST